MTSCVSTHPESVLVMNRGCFIIHALRTLSSGLLMGWQSLRENVRRIAPMVNNKKGDAVTSTPFFGNG